MPSDDFPRKPEDPQHEPPVEEPEGRGGLSRRALIQLGAVAGAGASLGGATLQGSPARASVAPRNGPHEELEEATVAELQALMESGELSAVVLVDMYLDRI